MRAVFNQIASFHLVDVSFTLSADYELSQSTVALLTLFISHAFLYAFWHCSGPFELCSYPLCPSIDVMRYIYKLIMCILHGLKFKRVLGNV